MTYLEEIQKSMNKLGEKGYIFLGQNMVAGGTSMFHTVKHLPINQRIEIPVFEDIQAGMAIGMVLEGLKVVSVYPRMDFLLLAFNQIINHLDKCEKMSDGQFKPKVIIRTCVGSDSPLMPGPQHMQNYTEALKSMVTNIDVVELLKSENVFPAYEKAMKSDRSTILIEHSDLYNKDLAFSEIKGSKEKREVKK